MKLHLTSHFKTLIQRNGCKTIVTLKIAYKSCRNFCNPIEVIRKENTHLEEELRQCDDIFSIKAMEPNT